jgi:hypothetical protein
MSGAVLPSETVRVVPFIRPDATTHNRPRFKCGLATGANGSAIRPRTGSRWVQYTCLGTTSDALAGGRGWVRIAP